MRQRMQQAAIVRAVGTGRPHQQRVLHAIGVHHPGELFQGRDLLPGGCVDRVGAIGKPRRVKQVVMAIDLGFFVDAQGCSRQASLRLLTELCYCLAALGDAVAVTIRPGAE
ncbi:hypothetical protein D9M72_650860 [compost metagenome]